MQSDFVEYPLITESNVMRTALMVCAEGPAAPEAVVRRLVEALRRIGETPPDDLSDIRHRVTQAFRELCIAGLLDPDERGTCVLTQRGRDMLAEHPEGIDASVLVRFSEYRAYVRDPFPFVRRGLEGTNAVEPKAAYDEGQEAYWHGFAITDNPHDFETVSHLDWENGWCQARDESGDAGEDGAGAPG